MSWTPELDALLLGCTTSADLAKNFPGRNLETLRRRRRDLRNPCRRTRDRKDRKTEEVSVDDRLNRIAQLLEESGIPLDEVARVEKVRIGQYQMLTKNNDTQEAEIHDLRADSLILTPKWADGPKWPVVQPAAPVVIQPTEVPHVDRSIYKVAVVLPDPQIGFRYDHRNKSLDPFHDELAMAVALQAIRLIQPDIIINLGDFLDFASFGKYVQEPAFAHTTQAAIDRGHLFLCEQQAAAPFAHIVLFEGNHDRRLQNSVIANAQAAFGLQRANMPESWPVMSVPNLLRLEELGVEYVDAYPAGRYWINDRLNCTHGHIVRSNGSTARAVADDERVSQIFGHIHRIEMHYKTVNVRDGGRTNIAISPGCLCRIDGAVPSTKGSTDSFGRAVTQYENWQQGLAIVTYEPGDGPFSVEHVYIDRGFGFLRGQPISSQ